MREPFMKDCLRPDRCRTRPAARRRYSGGQSPFCERAGREPLPPLARWRALEKAGKIKCIIAKNLQVRKFCTLKF
jgi:hypothetical protein